MIWDIYSEKSMENRRQVSMSSLISLLKKFIRKGLLTKNFQRRSKLDCAPLSPINHKVGHISAERIVKIYKKKIARKCTIYNRIFNNFWGAVPPPPLPEGPTPQQKVAAEIGKWLQSLTPEKSYRKPLFHFVQV